MSLSGWFRDYVYIPLGGNRVKAARHVFNILIVWMLTGFWHGADWNFMLWGAYFGLVLLMEKFFLAKVLEKMPILLRHVYVILIVFISWGFFDSIGFSTSFTTIGRMFGIGADGFAGSEALYYLRSYAVALIVGIAGATPMIKQLGKKITAWRLSGSLIEPIILALILIAATAGMVDGSFNPFIYFRF
jgi:alginate O-acetyltransferase complex protein AlgI